VKLAYWLSDVSEPGRGNLKVVPGSHVVNWIDGPPRRDIQWPDPEGAIEVTAEPGDAVFFDRRIWHTRSRNHSRHTRKAVFFGYTYRWTAIRDELAPIRASDWLGRLPPRPAAAARRRRGPRRGPRLGPRPGHYPTLRLAEGARLPRSGESAAQALISEPFRQARAYRVSLAHLGRNFVIASKSYGRKSRKPARPPSPRWVPSAPDSSTPGLTVGWTCDGPGRLPPVLAAPGRRAGARTAVGCVTVSPSRAARAWEPRASSLCTRTRLQPLPGSNALAGLGPRRARRLPVPCARAGALHRNDVRHRL
jgi:Phytanoyl-CoA dioxygenase (PhyH)